MNIEIKRFVQSSEMINIDFPVYSKAIHSTDVDGYGSAHYRMVRDDLSFIEIGITLGPKNKMFTINIGDKIDFDTDEPIDFITGSGEYTCSSEEFDEALAAARIAIRG